MPDTAIHCERELGVTYGEAVHTINTYSTLTVLRIVYSERWSGCVR